MFVVSCGSPRKGAFLFRIILNLWKSKKYLHNLKSKYIFTSSNKNKQDMKQSTKEALFALALILLSCVIF